MSFGGADGPTHMPASAIFLAMGATVTRAEIPELCANLTELLCDRAGGVVVCEVSGVTCPDLVTVEALARLRMTARRHGWRLAVGGAGPALRGLLDLLGLADVLPVADRRSSGEVGRQPEEREEAGGVQEVVDRRDASG